MHDYGPMTDCQFQYDPKARMWHCPVCKEPTTPKYSCNRKLCRRPPVRNCPAKRTPEQIAREQAARERAQHGPGAHLHRLIKKYSGEGITASCGCKNRIAEMNRRGPDWCRENIETIIDWLIEEVERRLKVAEDDDNATRWRLRLGGLDVLGRRFAMRQLILVAVRRAERKLLSNPQ